MKESILIIEDESGIAEALSYSLETEGYVPLWASTGKDGLEKLGDGEVHLVILDIGLPDMSGFDLIREIRKTSDIPVLFLTARSEEIDRVLGLELGGDDYIVKPFSPREVTARVKAVLRRSSAEKRQSDAHADTAFIVDENKREILYCGARLSLTRYEFDILALLARRPGWVFTREKIMEIIWNDPAESFERTVDAHIKTIRAKLREIRPDIDPIVTHRGIGYSLKERR